MSKTGIQIAKRTLEKLSRLHESFPVQSFDGSVQANEFLQKYNELVIKLYQCSQHIGNSCLNNICTRVQANLKELSTQQLKPDQFAVLDEWPVRMQAYLSDSENQQGIDDLVLNLSSKDWPIPLQTAEQQPFKALLINSLESKPEYDHYASGDNSQEHSEDNLEATAFFDIQEHGEDNLEATAFFDGNAYDMINNEINNDSITDNLFFSDGDAKISHVEDIGVPDNEKSSAIIASDKDAFIQEIMSAANTENVFSPENSECNDAIQNNLAYDESYGDAFEKDLQDILASNDAQSAISNDTIESDLADDQECHHNSIPDDYTHPNNFHEDGNEVMDHAFIEQKDTSSSDIENNKVEWTPEQQELLELLVAEVNDILNQRDSYLAPFHDTNPNKESVIETFELQIEQVERIGSAAEMIGLNGLHKLCWHVRNNFQQAIEQEVSSILQLRDVLSLWPEIVYEYLKDLYSENAHLEIVKFLQRDEWLIKTEVDEIEALRVALAHSTIEIDENDIEERKLAFTPEDISLEVPEDVHEDLVNGLLQELPNQTEELTNAIQNLRSENYMQQLEICQRIAHTLKGAGNTVGIQGIANLTHKLEDVFQALIKAESMPTLELHQTLISASDCLEEMSEFLLGMGDEPSDAHITLQNVLDWANLINEQGVPREEGVAPGSVERDLAQETGDVEDDILLHKPIESLVDAPKLKPEQPTAEAMLRFPASIIDDLLKRSGENIILNAQIHEQVLYAIAHLDFLKKNNERIQSLSQELEHLIEIQGITTKLNLQDPKSKFDPLEMDQFNELHTFANRLMETTADIFETTKNIENSLSNLDDLTTNQARKQRDNQEAVLKTRMVKVETIVPRLKRGIRQACKISAKSADLIIKGEKTLIDSELLNNLIDPLMHLLRNAVDHGIENPEVRAMFDKDEQGKIELSFKRDGGQVIVRCQDDGKGLDFDQIRIKAIQHKLINPDDELSNDEASRLILRHGFSTREEATQLSGRGVGMDVVYQRIRDMKGSIAIDSKKGKGVTVELSLPVTLLSTHALIVNSLNRKIAISNRGVDEILYSGAGQIYVKDGADFFRNNNIDYPLKLLDNMLFLDAKPISLRQSYAILIVRDEKSDTHAILANSILDTRDIVVKPFSRFIPKIQGLIGSTILGDGSVTTVVDLAELLHAPMPSLRAANKSSSRAANETELPVALIVEDSISTRRSLAEFTRDLGFEVITAKDGVEAIGCIQHKQPKIILTDLEMPRMNGLELTSHLRANEDTKNLPIIMITSRSTDKHKQEAKRIGVNTYITKPYSEDLLLKAIQDNVNMLAPG